jgi:hypothetical protein
MALVGNLICNINNFKITALNGTVNVGMTFNKYGESHGDTIVFGDEKFPVDDIKELENAKLPQAAIPLETSGLKSLNDEY